MFALGTPRGGRPGNGGMGLKVIRHAVPSAPVAAVNGTSTGVSKLSKPASNAAIPTVKSSSVATNKPTGPALPLTVSNARASTESAPSGLVVGASLKRKAATVETVNSKVAPVSSSSPPSHAVPSSASSFKKQRVDGTTNSKPAPVAVAVPAKAQHAPVGSPPVSKPALSSVSAGKSSTPQRPSSVVRDEHSTTNGAGIQSAAPTAHEVAQGKAVRATNTAQPSQPDSCRVMLRNLSFEVCINKGCAFQFSST